MLVFGKGVKRPVGRRGFWLADKPQKTPKSACVSSQTTFLQQASMNAENARSNDARSANDRRFDALFCPEFPSKNAGRGNAQHVGETARGGLLEHDAARSSERTVFNFLMGRRSMLNNTILGENELRGESNTRYLGSSTTLRTAEVARGPHTGGRDSLDQARTERTVESPYCPLASAAHLDLRPPPLGTDGLPGSFLDVSLATEATENAQVQGNWPGTSDSQDTSTATDTVCYRKQGKPDEQNENQVCAICLEDLGDCVGKMEPCGHSCFCVPCAKRWFSTKQTCPVCRKIVRHITKAHPPDRPHVAPPTNKPCKAEVRTSSLTCP